MGKQNIQICNEQNTAWDDIPEHFRERTIAQLKKKKKGRVYQMQYLRPNCNGQTAINASKRLKTSSVQGFFQSPQKRITQTEDFSPEAGMHQI